jgi:hypothetical protein
MRLDSRPGDGTLIEATLPAGAPADGVDDSDDAAALPAAATA